MARARAPLQDRSAREVRAARRLRGRGCGDLRVTGRTMAEKVWDAHVVHRAAAEPDLLYVDLHLVHEVTSPQAFEGLRLAGRRVRRPDLSVATMDHNVPTRGGVRAADELSRKQMEVLAENCRSAGIPLYQIGSRRQGIVHVIG